MAGAEFTRGTVEDDDGDGSRSIALPVAVADA
jgi:hypothetical protein